MTGITLLLLAFPTVSALRDVPLGECYDCEVTCFEDCALKFNREIITPDATLLQRSDNSTLDNHTTDKPKAMAKKNSSHIFSWRSKHPNQPSKETKAQLMDQANQFAHCLKTEECQGHPVSAARWTASGRDASVVRQSKACEGRAALVQTVIGKQRCQVSNPSCAQKCAVKIASPKPSFLQEVPLHPVKINVFAKGTINMDFCLKSCLAVTCGCDDAPGFPSREKIDAQVKANKLAGEPVKDTPPADKYRKATLAECAKGVFGKKVSKGMFINYGGGWQEICTKEFLATTLGVAIGQDTLEAEKRCASTAQDDVKYGCVWDNQSGECVVGFQPIGKCYIKYQNDGKRRFEA